MWCLNPFTGRVVARKGDSARAIADAGILLRPLQPPPPLCRWRFSCGAVPRNVTATPPPPLPKSSKGNGGRTAFLQRMIRCHATRTSSACAAQFALRGWSGAATLKLLSGCKPEVAQSIELSKVPLAETLLTQIRAQLSYAAAKVYGFAAALGWLRSQTTRRRLPAHDTVPRPTEAAYAQLEAYLARGPRAWWEAHRSDRTRCAANSSGTRPATEEKRQQQEADQFHCLRNTSVLDVELTDDQKVVLQFALRGVSLYVGGNAGTGKSALLRRIAYELGPHGRGLRIAVTGSTGIAALTVGGQTFHRTFAMRYRAGPQAGTRVPTFGDMAALQRYDVLIIDEVSLFDAAFLEAFDVALRAARPHTSNLPFGGLQLILSGDFMQLKLGSAPEHPAAGRLMFESWMFHAFLVPMQLVTKLRQGDDAVLAHALDRLRGGVMESSIMERCVAVRGNASDQFDQNNSVFLYPTRLSAHVHNQRCIAALTAAGAESVDYSPRYFARGVSSEWSETYSVSLPGARVTRKQMTSMVADAMTACHSKSDVADRPLGPAAPQSRLAPQLCVVEEARRDFTSRHRVRALKEVAHLGGVLSHPRRRRSATPSRLKAALTAMRDDGAISDFTEVETADESRRWASVMQSRGGGHIAPGLAKASGVDGELLKNRTIHRGARVMLVRNLSPTLVNGSIGTVVGFVEPSPETAPQGAYQRPANLRSNGLLPLVRFDHNEQVCVPLISVPLEGTARSHYVNFSVDVMPLVPAFAFTVHKVQGITINAARVVLDMQRSWRCDHLVYVAASRVRRLDQLHILNLSPAHLSVNERAHRFARNLPNALNMCSVFGDKQLPPSRWSSNLASRFGSLSRFRRALRLNRAAWAVLVCG